jgi:hypothetical protein
MAVATSNMPAMVAKFPDAVAFLAGILLDGYVSGQQVCLDAQFVPCSCSVSSLL